MRVLLPLWVGVHVSSGTRVRRRRWVASVSAHAGHHPPRPSTAVTPPTFSLPWSGKLRGKVTVVTGSGRDVRRFGAGR